MICCFIVVLLRNWFQYLAGWKNQPNMMKNLLWYQTPPPFETHSRLGLVCHHLSNKVHKLVSCLVVFWGQSSWVTRHRHLSRLLTLNIQLIPRDQPRTHPCTGYQLVMTRSSNQRPTTTTSALLRQVLRQVTMYSCWSKPRWIRCTPFFSTVTPYLIIIVTSHLWLHS